MGRSDKLLLSIPSVAEVIDGSVATVERLIEDGQLKTMRLRGEKKGRGLRVTRASLEDWITRRVSASQAAAAASDERTGSLRS